MRDREFLNEGYYGAYGQNPNRHTSGLTQNHNDWDSRAFDEARQNNYPPNINSRYSGHYQQNNPQHHNQQPFSDYQTQQRQGYSPSNRYHDYDNSYSERGRIGFSDDHRRSYNSRSMYAIPGPDPVTGRYQEYRPNANEPHENHDRGLGAQFKDEVRSWFGNEEAARRRRMDERDSLGEAWYSHNRHEPANQDLYPQRDRYYDNERDRNWVRNHNLNNGW